MSGAFTKQFLDFLLGVALGHESEFFKNAATFSHVLIFKPPMDAMVQGVALNYFNNLYDALAYLNDHTVDAPGPETQKLAAVFDTLCKSINHSPVCVINIAFRLYVQVHLGLDRSLLDVSSYDAYMASVEKQCRAHPCFTVPLTALFQHQCAGARVCERMPPGKKMFHLLPENCDKCAGCAKPREVVLKLHKCSGCKVTLYCGDKCQRAHWGVHKQTCGK